VLLIVQASRVPAWPNDALLDDCSQDTITGNPTTKNCTIAHWSHQYDAYTGDPNEYLQWQDSSYYSKTATGNKWGWVGGSWRHDGAVAPYAALHVEW
jgi:hypothetical protein